MRNFIFALVLLLAGGCSAGGQVDSSQERETTLSPNVDPLDLPNNPGDIQESPFGIEAPPTVTEERVDPAEFVRTWQSPSPQAAVIYWQIDGISRSAWSYVEYGPTSSYGHQTDMTSGRRWAQSHLLSGLQAGVTYHFRRVMQEGTVRILGEDETFTTPSSDGMLPVSGSALTESGATYLLTEDLTVAGTALEITGSDITLDLNGHTVTFGTAGGENLFGVKVVGAGMITVKNGRIVQGGDGNRGAAVGSSWRDDGAHVSGVYAYVTGSNSYPFYFFGATRNLELDHNILESDVLEIDSRHYPGNDLMRLDVSGDEVHVHDNLLSKGPHRGIGLSGEDGLTPSSVEIAYNDIQHHARFVNGYAINAHIPGLDIHHNRITSTGRGVHLTRANIQFHHNFMDTRGHMTLDDVPQGSGIWYERMVELHGIKFEGDQVTQARVYSNFVRITQFLPDEEWEYVPATPLNISAFHPNGMNEIYDNTIVALTEYANTRHGGYGDSGQWASSLYLVAMDAGPASGDQYAVYMHDNEFFSNDLFVSATGGEPNMTVRVEDNTFTLVDSPAPTSTATPFRGLSSEMEESVLTSGNVFVEM